MVRVNKDNKSKRGIYNARHRALWTEEQKEKELARKRVANMTPEQVAFRRARHKEYLRQVRSGERTPWANNPEKRMQWLQDCVKREMVQLERVRTWRKRHKEEHPKQSESVDKKARRKALRKERAHLPEVRAKTLATRRRWEAKKKLLNDPCAVFLNDDALDSVGPEPIEIPPPEVMVPSPQFDLFKGYNVFN